MSDPSAPQPPGTPAPGYPVPPGYSAVLPTNGKATAALVTGITTLVFSWCCGAGVLGVVAVVLGLRARTEVRLSHGTQGGDGLALAGIITGALAVVVGLVVIALVVLVVASGRAAFSQ